MLANQDGRVGAVCDGLSRTLGRSILDMAEPGEAVRIADER
jgi:hypothetical protein